MKEYNIKIQSKNVMNKVKENDELKSAEVNVLTKFIKDEVKSFSNDNVNDVNVDADIDNDDDDE